MAWTTPRTWVVGETTTVAMLNAHIRDNFTLLKTHIADDGWPLVGVKNFAGVTGQGNAAGGGDTQLTSYDVTLPAYLLEQPGDRVVVESLWSIGASAGTSYIKIQVASGTLVTLLASAGWRSTLVYIRASIIRATQATGGIVGTIYAGAAAGGAPTPYLISGSLAGGGPTIDWHTSQTLKHFAADTSADNLKLWYLQTHLQKAKQGALV